MAERHRAVETVIAITSLIATMTALCGVVIHGLDSSLAYCATLIGIVLFSVVFTDAGTGLVHHFFDAIREHHVWPRSLLIVGNNFQQHHVDPRDLAKHPFAFHTFHSQMVITPLLVGMALLTWTQSSWDALVLFLVTVSNGVLLAQEFHRAAHQLPNERWKIITVLQNAGLALQPAMHQRHHTEGHATHFAILTGRTNLWLDSWEFCLALGGPKSTMQQKLLAWVSRMQAPIDWAYWDGLHEYQQGRGPDEITV